MRAIRLLIAACLAALAYAPASQAALRLTPISGSFTNPIYLTSPPGDTARQFVVQRGGAILVIKDGVLLSQPYVTVPRVSIAGEGGLLSMAFDPNFAINRRFYVYYTITKRCVPSMSGSGCPIRIDEFKAHTAAADVANPNSQRRVIEIKHPFFSNHNGGQLQFGPDGLLYAGTGDGGSGDDPFGNAQNPRKLLGKMLRIDPHPQPGGAPYGIPGDNPYAHLRGKDEVYAIGLRNPFRFSFDHLTGDLLIGDVGQGVWEEIDYAAGGAALGKNLGWDVCEGKHVSGSTGTLCTLGAADKYFGPTFEYQHTGGNCSIIGGFVSRDNAVSDTAGRYLYADLCVGDIRSIAATGTGDASTGLSTAYPYSFGQDGQCRLYVINGGGSISRIDSTTPGTPGCATS